MTAACDAVADAFAHREPRRVPLWGILNNRPVYEHVLGPQRVGTAAEVALDDKLALHAEVYRALGIDITRAHIWPPDRSGALAAGTTWREHTVAAADVAGWAPSLPDDAARDEEVAVRCRQIAINRPHSIFAPSVRGVFCPLFEQMGLEEFSYACHDAPGEIQRLMDVLLEYAVSLAERYAARPEVRYVAVCDDVAFKSGLIFPPAWMRRHWRGRLGRLLRPLKDAGVTVIFHSDGNVREIVPDLIELGVDGLNPLEPLAGMDLAELKRDFGGDITLVGGVDCAQLLTFGRPGEIRDEVRRLLDIGAPGGGFIIGDSSQINPNAPVENVLAFYEAVRE
jgi:hypothetical protein